MLSLHAFLYSILFSVLVSLITRDALSLTLGLDNCEPLFCFSGYVVI